MVQLFLIKLKWKLRSVFFCFELEIEEKCWLHRVGRNEFKCENVSFEGGAFLCMQNAYRIHFKHTGMAFQAGSFLIRKKYTKKLKFNCLTIDILINKDE